MPGMSFPLDGPYGPVPEGRGFEPGGYVVPTGDLPPRPPSPGARLGRANGVEVRRESQHASSNAVSELTVLAFRLLEPGNPQPLDVLMRGRSLSGTVRDGDWVEVAGPANDAGRWNVAKVQNLTTGSTVLVMGGRGSKATTVVVLVVLAILTLLILLFVVGVVVSLASS